MKWRKWEKEKDKKKEEMWGDKGIKRMTEGQEEEKQMSDYEVEGDNRTQSLLHI
jgi:hypothetical protein